MTMSELNRFRAILTTRITELERLTRRRDGIVIERNPDQIEEIQQAQERLLTVCHLDRDFSHLRNARAALLRIQDGSFGTCEQCGGEIHSKRLAAVPWAPLCIRCQEAADRGPEEMPMATRGLLIRAA